MSKKVLCSKILVSPFFRSSKKKLLNNLSRLSSQLPFWVLTHQDLFLCCFTSCQWTPCLPAKTPNPALNLLCFCVGDLLSVCWDHCRCWSCLTCCKFFHSYWELCHRISSTALLGLLWTCVQMFVAVYFL